MSGTPLTCSACGRPAPDGGPAALHLHSWHHRVVTWATDAGTSRMREVVCPGCFDRGGYDASRPPSPTDAT